MTTSNGTTVQGSVPKPMFKKMVPTTQQRVAYELMTKHGVPYSFFIVSEKKIEKVSNPFNN